jgi:prepilin-type N-terminal cleavage/methylation domain-containing protein
MIMSTKKSQSAVNSAGFTLIELLVVVVIIGILGGIAAPGWLGFLNRQKVNAVKTDLKAVLQQAQTRAQQRSASYGVVFGSTASGPTTALSTEGATFPPVTLGSNAKNVRIIASVASTAATTSASRLDFDYQGGLSANSVPFVIKISADNNVDNQQCLIISSLLGSIVESKQAACDSPNLGL